MGVVLTLSVALAIAIARAFLGSIFWVMTEGGVPFTFYWKRVFFVGALFWCWYLTPTLAESRATTRALSLLTSSQHGTASPAGAFATSR